MDIKNNEKNPGMEKSQKMQILPKVMDFFYIKTEKKMCTLHTLFRL